MLPPLKKKRYNVQQERKRAMRESRSTSPRRHAEGKSETPASLVACTIREGGTRRNCPL